MLCKFEQWFVSNSVTNLAISKKLNSLVLMVKAYTRHMCISNIVYEQFLFQLWQDWQTLSVDVLSVMHFCMDLDFTVFICFFMLSNKDCYNQVFDWTTLILNNPLTWCRCGPCKIIAPKFEKLSEKYLDVVFLKLDCNQENKVNL